MAWRGRLFSVLTFLSLAAVSMASCQRKKNPLLFPGAPVILISIDTLRADRLPAYGYANVKTPHLDSFLADAWFFENAYSPCPMTLPSHVTMLTGKLPPEHGVRNNSGFVFDGTGQLSLPQLLRQQGYATGAAVSTYVLRQETGLGAEFDFYEDSVDTPPGVAAVHYQRKGDRTAAFANEWIEKHSQEPFFFLFHIFEPHMPWDPPEPFRGTYGATYEGEVASADAIVGAFLENLKRLGVYDRALVFVTSDHGEGLGDHGEEQHSLLLYREAIRVPLLLKLPRSSGAKTRVEAPVQLSDIFPTVTHLLGLETPAGVTGLPLLAMADKSRAQADRVIYSETLYPRLQLGFSELKSVLDARYHLIHGPRPELYDMKEDPEEKRDLIKKETSVAARLARELQRFPLGNEKPASEDQETMKRLASLGYIGGLRDRGSPSDLPNPVDSLHLLSRMQEGWHLAAEKKTQKAIEVLGAVVKESPGMTEAWIKLAELHAQAGEDEKAAAAYRIVLSRSPVPLPDIAIALALLELNRQQYGEAERLARESISTLPGKAHHVFARIALARGNVERAEQEAHAAVSSRNPQPQEILLLAEVQLAGGRPGEALREVERADLRARELKLADVYRLEFLRGDALARMGKYGEAEAAFKKEIASFPSQTQPYVSLAILGHMKGDRAAVDRLMEEMVRANPVGKTWLAAANAYEAMGEKEKAAILRKQAGKP